MNIRTPSTSDEIREKFLHEVRAAGWAGLHLPSTPRGEAICETIGIEPTQENIGLVLRVVNHIPRTVLLATHEGYLVEVAGSKDETNTIPEYIVYVAV